MAKMASKDRPYLDGLWSREAGLTEVVEAALLPLLPLFEPDPPATSGGIIMAAEGDSLAASVRCQRIDSETTRELDQSKSNQ